MSRDNHQDVVAAVFQNRAPEHTVESVLDAVVRVIRLLPRDERAGLLRKDAGENITPFHGVMCSAGRICYPDGQLYKIATDIPTTNAAVWNDDGQVEPSRYFDITPFLDASADPPATPNPPAPPAEIPPTPDELGDDDVQTLVAATARIVQGMTDVRESIDAIAAGAIIPLETRLATMQGSIEALGAKIEQLQLRGIAAHLRL